MKVELLHSLLEKGLSLMPENVMSSLQVGALLTAISVASLFGGLGIAWGVNQGKTVQLEQTQQRHEAEIQALTAQYSSINVQLARQQQLLLDIKARVEAP